MYPKRKYVTFISKTKSFTKRLSRKTQKDIEVRPVLQEHNQNEIQVRPVMQEQNQQQEQLER
jgi:hypothetical protein